MLPRRAPGLPDEAFERDDVPMTKQEVRAAVLAKLAVRPEDILWDVGAGTGSVSVELALAAPRGPGLRGGVQAGGLCAHQSQPRKIQDPEPRPRGGACPRRPFGPARAGRVFIGGSKGQPLPPSWTPALDRTPTPASACRPSPSRPFRRPVAALTAKGRNVQVSQIAVSRAKAVGGLHLMMAQNPIYLITGE